MWTVSLLWWGLMFLKWELDQTSRGVVNLTTQVSTINATLLSIRAYIFLATSFLLETGAFKVREDRLSFYASKIKMLTCRNTEQLSEIFGSSTFGMSGQLLWSQIDLEVSLGAGLLRSHFGPSCTKLQDTLLNTGVVEKVFSRTEWLRLFDEEFWSTLHLCRPYHPKSDDLTPGLRGLEYHHRYHSPFMTNYQTEDPLEILEN